MKCHATLTLTAGSDVECLDDIHNLPHRARLEYVPGEDSLYISVGAAGIQTKRGECYAAGRITKEAALALLDLLNAWNDGAYE
jgi:hypothetical protein